MSRLKSPGLNEMAPPPTPTGLRAQLGQLLPRHAHFRAHILIHQISSIPFVGGEFSVRWKFKAVQTTPQKKSNLKSPEDTLFSPLLSSFHFNDSTSLLAVTPTATSSASSLHTLSLPGTNTPLDPGTPARGSTPFVPLKDHSVVWSHSLHTTLKFDIDRDTSYLLPNPLKLVILQRIVPGDPHGNPQNPRLGAVYLNLSEYIAQGSVTRRYLLKESKTNAVLKLTIQLQHLSGETNYIPPPLAKGEILNGIAGYLEKDSVKKRPRPLDLYGPYRNQEELETDLLSGLKSTVKAPKTARSERKVSDARSNSTVETETEDETTTMASFEDEEEEEEDEEDEEEDGNKVNVAFDVQRLPAAYGTKTTEILIESLFNPVKVADKTEESPFTIYHRPDEDQPRARARRVGVGLGLSGLEDPRTTVVLPPSRENTVEESGSMYATSDSASVSASEISHVSSPLGRVSGYGRGLGRGRGHVKVGSEDSATSSNSISAMRNWWRRNMSKHNLQPS